MARRSASVAMKTLLIGAGGALSLMTAAGVWATTSGSGDDGQAAMGPGLQIALVAPREPTPEPGGVMQVGELRDDYTHDPALFQAADPYDPWLQVAWIEPEPMWSDPAPIDAYEPAPEPVRPPPPVRLDPADRSFGFDEPRIDYAAERAARMARLEAVETAARAVSEAVSAPGELRRESVFF